MPVFGFVNEGMLIVSRVLMQFPVTHGLTHFQYKICTSHFVLLYFSGPTADLRCLSNKCSPANLNLPNRGVWLVNRNPPKKQKPNLWDALPVAKMLIYKHSKADAPNVLLYATSLHVSHLAIRWYLLSGSAKPVLLRVRPQISLILLQS